MVCKALDMPPKAVKDNIIRILYLREMFNPDILSRPAVISMRDISAAFAVSEINDIFSIIEPAIENNITYMQSFKLALRAPSTERVIASLVDILSALAGTSDNLAFPFLQEANDTILNSTIHPKAVPLNTAMTSVEYLRLPMQFRQI